MLLIYSDTNKLKIYHNNSVDMTKIHETSKQSLLLRRKVEGANRRQKHERVEDIQDNE